jgi:hypothetical protein
MASMTELQWQIRQKTAKINVARVEADMTVQNIRQALADPVVMCGGLATGFLIGYFLIPKPHAAPATKKPPMLHSLEAVLTSPLFLFATTLLK